MLICHAFKRGEDFSHYDWWQNEVAGFVARKWKTGLRRSQSQIVEEIKLLTYAFPRGRVTKTENGSLILHGRDIDRFMRISKRSIAAAFGISSRCKWQFDEHEQCQTDDKETARQYFRIREDWKSV